MSVNSQCEFYFSLVSLLEEFFNQEGAKRISLFWMAVPQEKSTATNSYDLEAMFSWQINLDGFTFKGSSCDDLWETTPFVKEFWGCYDSIALSTKMKEMICEHAVDTNRIGDFKGVLGATFIKDNWIHTVNDRFGVYALSKKNAKDLNDKLLDIMSSCDCNNLSQNETEDFKI